MCLPAKLSRQVCWLLKIAERHYCHCDKLHLLVKAFLTQFLYCWIEFSYILLRIFVYVCEEYFSSWNNECPLVLYVETYFFLHCLGEIVFRWNFVLCACECFRAFAESPAERGTSCLGVVSNGRLFSLYVHWTFLRWILAVHIFQNEMIISSQLQNL